MQSDPDENGTRRPRIAILIAEGFDDEAAEAIHTGLFELGAVPQYVGLQLGSVTSVQGVPFDADVSLDTNPAALFSAVVIPGGKEHVALLCAAPLALEFVRAQYRDAKPILALQEGAALVESAGAPVPIVPEHPDPRMLVAKHATAADALPEFVQAITQHRQQVQAANMPHDWVWRM